MYKNIYAVFSHLIYSTSSWINVLVRVLRFYRVSKCFLKWVFMQPWCSYALFLYRRFPNYYYSLSYNIPGGGVVQILMIDTVLLCGNTGDDSLHDQPHGPVDLDKADDQLAWITQSMKNSRYSWPDLIIPAHRVHSLFLLCLWTSKWLVTVCWLQHGTRISGLMRYVVFPAQWFLSWSASQVVT